MRTRIVLTLVFAALAAAAITAGAIADKPGDKPHKKSATHAKKAKVDTRALFAVLTGRNEVDATTGRRGAGDPDAHGSFTAIVDGNQLCFGITVTNLDTPTAAHIHKARPNQNGAIVVPLTQPPTGDPGASSGCTTIDPTLGQAILKNPHKYYANVHTSAFPNGAVRGQLSRKSH
jgi:CHRD domain